MTSPEEHPVLLRVAVGSRAHGTATAGSDFDYREVFCIPTRQMLSLGRDRLKFAWQTSNKFTDDEGGHEIAEFLHLVAKGAPNAVEMLFAPQADDLLGGARLDAAAVRAMGRSVLNRKSVEAGVIGYAMNSFRKVADRPGKWKGGMLRVLYQGLALIETGETSLVVPEHGWGEIVRSALRNGITDGEALDEANTLIEKIKRTSGPLPNVTDWSRANEWLLALRRDRW